MLGRERERLREVARRGRRRSGPGCRRGGRARCCRSRRHAECRTRAGRRPALARRSSTSSRRGWKRLRAERDAVDAVLAQQRRERGRDRLRVRLDRQLLRPAAARRAGARGAAGSVNVGVPPPRKIVSGARREQTPLELELREQRVDVGAVLPAPAEDGDEVAVAAPVRAERQVHVEVRGERLRGSSLPGGRREAPYRNATRTLVTRVQRLRANFVPIALVAAHRSPSRLSTARNASCGTSTPPTCFIRFLPFFCFSSSFRLRVMSPP